MVIALNKPYHSTFRLFDELLTDDNQTHFLSVKFIQHPERPSLNEPMIHFYYEDIAIPGFREEEERSWIIQCISNEGRVPGELGVIFCRDNYLLELNKKYLNHHEYTDVITFDYAGTENTISGDIFISHERVVDNAHALGERPERELLRVLIHGVLHLLGHADQTPGDQAEMHRKENYYLSLREQI